jgi:curved DNA-binding protein CbpA
VAVAPSRFEDAVIEHVRSRSTGGLEATDGRRRWQFFLDGGRLVCTRSNVKSEQDQALQAVHADEDSMAEAQAVLRLDNVSKAEGVTWKFHRGAQPPQRRAPMADQWMASRLGTDTGAEAAAAEPDLGFDIGALIAEEVGQGQPRDEASKGDASRPKPKPSPPSNRTASPKPSTATTPEARLKELDRQVLGADNYFQMFGLPWEAPTEQFRQRFMDFARELHPDKYNSAAEPVRLLATELFDRIRGAWEVIEKEDERKKYTDRVIHGKKSDEEEAMEKVQAYYKAESNFKRGLAAFTNGRTNEAHTFFKSAVEDSPEEYEFLVYYGYTLFFTSRTKDPQMAAQGLSLIQRVLKENEKQDRKLDSGWILLGRAWRDQGDFNEALRAFKTAHELNPGNSEAKRQYQRTKEQMDGAAPASGPSGFLSRVFGKDATGGKTGTKNRR